MYNGITYILQLTAKRESPLLQFATTSAFAFCLVQFSKQHHQSIGPLAHRHWRVGPLLEPLSFIELTFWNFDAPWFHASFFSFSSFLIFIFK